MSPILRVKSPGLHTTVQDLGRDGFADVGVPPSGALDAVGLRLANALLGNRPDAAALEVLVGGPELEVIAESAHVAFVGGTAGISVQDAHHRSIAAGRSVHVKRGDVVKIGMIAGSSCGYLALEGGIGVPRVLGSASTYTRGTLGGFEGRALRAGDVLHGAETEPAGEELELATPLESEFDAPIRIVLGPQDDHFTQDAIAAFLAGVYIVSAQADRMGFRLEGPVLAHTRGYNIVSDGIVSGSIQVPGSGQPIVLMRDYQTIGGYPKIATVISPDISRLGRRSAGAKVRFARVSRDEAEAVYRDEEAFIAERIKALRPARDEASLNIEALYDENLIGGIVSARE
ncbi:MAG: biotin-dependent carboxyltransferase family protein [Methylobacteriaceae bacterium]|nr:biotin-dependent carboxyltransferase family protein [Methylobacteriaceae bacterium]